MIWGMTLATNWCFIWEIVTVGEQPASSLEKVYRQANVTIRELVLKGNGQASMIPTLDSLF